MNYKTKCRNAKDDYEHRVVWIAHNGEIPSGYCIHHINGNKRDNRIENLALMTIADHSAMHDAMRRGIEWIGRVKTDSERSEKKSSWYFKNHERELEKHRKYYRDHKDEDHRRCRAYRLAHHEELRIKKREYYLSHREEICARARSKRKEVMP